MNILGINAFHGDASAALLADGNLISAVEEERFNRIKHWAGFPALAIEACLKGTDRQELAHVAISRDPRAQLGRKLLRMATRPGDWSRLRRRASNSWRVAQVGREVHESGLSIPATARVHHVEHHRAHLASAFFASPFEEAAVISVDGFGDFSSVMWGVGKGSEIEVLGSVRFPHSLGIFYTAFTQFLGFPKYGDEYKMMGLAAYGEPCFLSQVRDVVQTRRRAGPSEPGLFCASQPGCRYDVGFGRADPGTVFSCKCVRCLWRASPELEVKSLRSMLIWQPRCRPSWKRTISPCSIMSASGRNRSASVWPEAWRSTVRPTERFSSEHPFRRSISSRQLMTPGRRLVRPSMSIIRC